MSCMALLFYDDSLVHWRVLSFGCRSGYVLGNESAPKHQHHSQSPDMMNRPAFGNSCEQNKLRTRQHMYVLVLWHWQLETNSAMELGEKENHHKVAHKPCCAELRNRKSSGNHFILKIFRQEPKMHNIWLFGG